MAASVVVTAGGDVLLASHVQGVGSVGGERAGTPDEESTVLSRYDANGRFREERWYPEFFQEVALGVTNDGGFTLKANAVHSDVGGGPDTAVPRSLLASFAPDGRWRWERAQVKGEEAFATSPKGEVAAMNMGHPMDIYPRHLEFYGPDGRLRWERSMENGAGDGDGLEGYLSFVSLAFAADGNLLAAGNSYASFVMDSQRFTFSQLSTPVLLKLDSRTGRLLWAVGLDRGEWYLPFARRH